VQEREGVRIGAVIGVQGISWTKFVIEGQSNHRGTTPMAMRRDAGALAAAIAVEARCSATDFGPPQVAAVGAFDLTPGLVSVVPARARPTVDLRNTDDAALTAAEAWPAGFVRDAAAVEHCSLTARSLARFAPVAFDDALAARIEAAASARGLSARGLSVRGLSVRRVPMGAGHDAQMFAPNCPTAMIFVPSEGGLSHNIHQHADEADLLAGAEVLLDLAPALGGVPASAANSVSRARCSAPSRGTKPAPAPSRA
jgi:N-carbamoyl-L-amino-acid hydrolase